METAKETTDASCQGYALIEYLTLEEARAAIDGANDTKLLDQTIQVDFAFVRPPPGKAGGAANRGGGRGAGPNRGHRSGRSRSRSPGAGAKDHHHHDDQDDDA